MIEYTIATVETHPIIAVNCQTSTKQKDISKAIRRSYLTVAAYIQEAGIMPMGPAVTLYHDINEEEVNFSLGFPVGNQDVKRTSADVELVYIPGGKVAKAYHKGPYSGLFKTYVEIYKAMREDGLDHGGTAWEVYLDSPGQTPEEELLTQIYISIQ